MFVSIPDLCNLTPFKCILLIPSDIPISELAACLKSIDWMVELSPNNDSFLTHLIPNLYLYACSLWYLIVSILDLCNLTYFVTNDLKMNND